jgi:hypothetical protein
MTDPVQAMCGFPECTAMGCFGFRAPGIANLAHRSPDAPEVWTCGGHRADGPALLQVKIETAARERASGMASKARQGEGLLL